MAAARQSKPDQSVTKGMLKIKGQSDPPPTTHHQGRREKTLGLGWHQPAAAAGHA
jgi:hypothetical protein